MVLDLREISTFTDFFVICSGTSEPHLKAIAGEIETRLREDHEVRPAAIDGFPTSQWIVLDYLQVIVHVFHREKRDFYSLEDLWSDAPRLAIALVNRRLVEQRGLLGLRRGGHHPSRGEAPTSSAVGDGLALAAGLAGIGSTWLTRWAARIICRPASA